MEDFRFLHDSYEDDSVPTPVTAQLPDIFLVEDDRMFGRTIKRYLEKKLSLNVQYFSGPNECLEFLSNWGKAPFCLVSDISFGESDADGLFLIDILSERNLNFASIVMTGFASIETAINATKKGVYHYLTKPFEPEFLVSLVVEAIEKRLGIRRELLLKSEEVHDGGAKYTPKFKLEAPRDEDIFEGMVGRSKKMQAVFETLKKVAQSDSTILITGPSGTGKELVAAAVHNLSKRKDQKKVSVNCGAIPSDLLESELFGHVKGAFTGAISDKKGKFERANHGTIFLDEMGDMPLLLQVKLLRVLQNREIEQVGGSEVRHIDVRVITATHRNLEEEVKKGNFREDLYYRLNVIPLKIPALCERREDIPLLISYFLSRYVSADGRNQLEFTNEALEMLISYDWPGNVRQLENVIERLVILKGGSVVTHTDLPEIIQKFFGTNGPVAGLIDVLELPEDGIDLKQILSEIEDSLIRQALDRTQGNKNRASKLLAMNRTTLIEKMKKKGMAVDCSVN